MKKIITLTAFALLLGVGCTAQQRRIVSNALADDSASAPPSTMTFIDYAPTDTVAVADPPVPASNVVAVADCATFSVNVSGYEDGTAVYVGEGAQPPFGFTVGGSGSYFQFTPQPGGAFLNAMPVGSYEATHGYSLIVDVQRPSTGFVNQRVAQVDVAC